MSGTLSDEDLKLALADAAESFPASEPGQLGEELVSQSSVLSWPRRRTVQLLGVAAAAVVAVVLVANVSSGPSLQQQDSRATSGVPVPGTGGEGYALGDGGGGGTGAGATTGGAIGGSLQLDKGALGVSGSTNLSSGSTGGVGQLPATQPGGADAARIVQTGSISVVVDDGKVAGAMSRLRAIAKNVGGYVADEQTQGIGDNPTGTITMRVPVARFASVVAEITGKGFGAKVISSQSSGQDVTADYADTAAQITSLKAARGRYLTILNAAKTVGEILSVQQRVDEVQSQIDRLEGARRVLANQSDLATVTVMVNERKSEALNTERSGWSKAWHDAVHGFTSGVESLVAHSGRALLVLLVAIAVLLIGRFGWRLARRRLI